MEVSILTIPSELLVIVMSYLSSRDRAKLRYISQSLRIVSETPSLWHEFLWDYYNPREELCVMNVLKRCEENIKRLAFPGYLTPKLDEMLQYCNNVRHVSLPVVMTMSPDQLGEAVQHMKHLHTLDIGWNVDYIKPLLLMGSNLIELTLYASNKSKSFLASVHTWVQMGFRPPKLNVVFTAANCVDFGDLVGNWQQWNAMVPVGHIAYLKLYTRVKTSLDLCPVLPGFQLQFGQTAVLPLVQAKQCGISVDYLLLTDCCISGKTMYKAIKSLLSCPFSNVITDLKFLTHVDLVNYQSLLPGDLQQLAISCPNLQQLNLRNCSQCLKSLQGMRAIASHCHNLQGLDISGIAVTELESQIQFWEILSTLKLTHIKADFCIISPCIASAEYEEMIISLYKKCLDLLAIQSLSLVHGCRSYVLAKKDWIILCHFPSLKYC